MNVSLTPELERLVKDRVATGLYNSASEVIRESLRLLEARDRMNRMQLEQLRAEVAKGIDDLDNGRYTDLDDAGLAALLDDIKARGRRRLAALKRKRA
ncbi:MAG: type II toxin-antitoxin system ParD family antitoxin [Phycisphaerae bacterium]|nr:type II toxin-antitoxin system ParD family antitoxin [Phycisphaerae bacterium]